MTEHDNCVKDQKRYLKTKGYVILIDDSDKRALKPDLLAFHPETRSLVWVEVEQRQGKLNISKHKAEKTTRVEHLMEKVKGQFKLVFIGDADT